MSPFIQFQFSSNPTYLKVTEVVLTLRERGHELQCHSVPPWCVRGSSGQVLIGATFIEMCCEKYFTPQVDLFCRSGCNSSELQPSSRAKITDVPRRWLG